MNRNIRITYSEIKSLVLENWSFVDTSTVLMECTLLILNELRGNAIEKELGVIPIDRLTPSTVKTYLQQRIMSRF